MRRQCLRLAFHLIVLSVRRRTQCGKGRFCLCFLASVRFVRKVFWEGCGCIKRRTNRSLEKASRDNFVTENKTTEQPLGTSRIAHHGDGIITVPISWDVATNILPPCWIYFSLHGLVGKPSTSITVKKSPERQTQPNIVVTNPPLSSHINADPISSQDCLNSVVMHAIVNVPS